MASVYPGALDSFATNKANATATTTDHPNHHNDLADAVNKIEAELGVTPSGAAATVAARFGALVAPYSVGNAEDVLWQSDLADFTDVDLSGNHTITEKDGFLSVKFDGQTSNLMSGRLKARTFAIGDTFAVRLDLTAILENFSRLGLALPMASCPDRIVLWLKWSKAALHSSSLDGMGHLAQIPRSALRTLEL